jgi:hypothetical protein
LETLVIQKENKYERERVRKRALRFVIEGKRLYYRDPDGGLKLCLRKADVKEVLQEFHEGAMGGHFGRDITIGRIRQHFWWPTIWKDVSDHIKTCDNCQRYGPKGHHNTLHPYRPVYPFEVIFLDFVIKLPTTARGNKHLITMTEGLTKWIEAKPVREATATTASKFLMENIVFRFGVPTIVITDNGSHFRGTFHETCEKMGIEHRFATAYHPQTVGQDERTNGLLLGRIRKWRIKKYNKWDEDIPASILACNTRKISTTGFSAMEKLMGYTAGTAVGLKLMRSSKKEIRRRMTEVSTENSGETVEARLRMLETLRDEAVRMRDDKSRLLKERYDKKVRSREFEIGEEVLAFDSSLVKQWSRKLEERWQGPFTIVWKGTLGAYSVDVGGGKTRMISGDHLKRYHRRA